MLACLTNDSSPIVTLTVPELRDLIRQELEEANLDSKRARALLELALLIQDEEGLLQDIAA